MDTALQVRPVQAQDAPAEQAFVGALSAASRYRRFHIALRELPPSLLRAMTDHQRRGIGRALVERLVQRAREHGVQQLVGDVLWDNAPMMAMVRALGGKLVASAANVSALQARFDV
jgi:GNAT superfamily N-acetyltransferase